MEGADRISRLDGHLAALGLFGLVSLAAVLPMALAAREMGLLSRRAANLWIAAGIVFLALATLMRKSIGMMGLMVTAAVVIVLLVRRSAPPRCCWSACWPCWPSPRRDGW